MNPTPRRPSHRPAGVLFLAVLQVWHGLWYLLLLLVFLGVSSTAQESGKVALSGVAFLFAIAYFVLGLYALWLARGYVRGYEWARRRGIGVAEFAIVLVFVGLIFVKLQIFLPDSPFWTIVGNIVIIWYLRRDKTRRFFAYGDGRK